MYFISNNTIIIYLLTRMGIIIITPNTGNFLNYIFPNLQQMGIKLRRVKKPATSD